MKNASRRSAGTLVSDVAENSAVAWGDRGDIYGRYTRDIGETSGRESGEIGLGGRLVVVRSSGEHKR